VPLPPPWSTLQGRMVDGLLSEPRRTFVQLLEFDGEDLRGSPLTARKEVLAWLPGGWSAGIALNAHYEAEGAIVYPACSAARHRVEAPGIPVSGQPRRLLAEGQDPSSTGSHARSQGGMELVKGLLERLIVRRFNSTGAGTLLAPLAPQRCRGEMPPTGRVLAPMARRATER
jgi:hypothetical protein